MPRSDPARVDGQASLEWLAVVALVAALLALGAAVSQGVFVGRTVTRQMARALCVVSLGDCARDREACVVAAKSRRTGMAMSVLFVRLGGHAVGIVERRSDGTFAVTLGSELAGGAGLSTGARLGLNRLAIGGAAELSLVAQHVEGGTWIVDSAAAAAELVRRYRATHRHRHADERPPPPLRSADIAYDGLDVSGWAGVSASAQAVVTVGSASGGLSFERHARTSLDRRTGHRTVYVDGTWGLGGDVHAHGALDASTQLAGAGGERYAVEFDAAGRPVDLQVVASGAYAGSADLPPALSPAAGLLPAPATGGAYELTAHLDLTDPASLAVARDVLAQIARRGVVLPAAGLALDRRIAEVGTLEARVLRERSSGLDLSAGLGAGLQAALSYQRDTQSSQLVAAASRGLDGQWLPRDDCVARV